MTTLIENSKYLVLRAYEATRKIIKKRKKIAFILRKRMRGFFKKRVQKNIRVFWLKTSTYIRKRARFLWHVTYDRSLKRTRQFQERVAEYRDNRKAKIDIRRLNPGSLPLIVGPWLSEVGYEVLYWIPFLRWMKAKKKLSSDQIIIISRGGVASWYQDIGETYIEMFDFISPEEFSLRNSKRRDSLRGSHKQLDLSELDHEMISAAKKKLGISRTKICHPGLMYRLFRPIWAGHQPLQLLESHTRFIRQNPKNEFKLNGLPEDYIAVKFYTTHALPDNPQTRSSLLFLVKKLSERTNLVLLDTSFNLDDHQDFLFQDSSRVFQAKEFMTPQNNLAIQTQIIRNAKSFVGTCGSLIWLAPMLGVHTVAVMTDTRFLHVHLSVAFRVYRMINAGTFELVDLNALDSLGLIRRDHES